MATSAPPAAPSGPTASATPAASLVRLTEPGCCPLPFWSADSRSVLYWFAEPGQAAAVFGVPLTGGTPARVTDRPAGVHRGGAFSTLQDGEETRLTRTADGARWTFDTGGDGLAVSFDGERAAWSEELGRYVPGQRPPPVRHHLADLASGDEGVIDTPEGYTLFDWAADGAWLMTRTDRQRADLPALIRFDLASGETRALMDGRRLRSGMTSRDGRWVAFSRTDEDVAEDNGLFIVATDGESAPVAVGLFGGYRWRDGERLLVVPLEPGAPSMELWQLDAATGRTERLLDPATMPLRIAAGEWAVSPDGAHVAFRSADDDAIWRLSLPWAR
jgi:hypothetical protein